MNTRLLLLTLLLPAFASAQFLAPDTPLQQAFIEATQKDKLIFLMIESAECQQCNDVADKALQNDSLKKDIKKNFIALRISPLHPDLNYIQEKYNYQAGNVVLFLDKWGTLVHRMNLSTTNITDMCWNA
jgi:thioredoxin-related protein